MPIDQDVSFIEAEESANWFPYLNNGALTIMFFLMSAVSTSAQTVGNVLSEELSSWFDYKPASDISDLKKHMLVQLSSILSTAPYVDLTTENRLDNIVARELLKEKQQLAEFYQRVEAADNDEAIEGVRSELLEYANRLFLSSFVDKSLSNPNTLDLSLIRTQLEYFTNNKATSLFDTVVISGDDDEDDDSETLYQFSDRVVNAQFDEPDKWLKTFFNHRQSFLALRKFSADRRSALETVLTNVASPIDSDDEADDQLSYMRSDYLMLLLRFAMAEDNSKTIGDVGDVVRRESKQFVAELEKTKLNKSQGLSAEIKAQLQVISHEKLNDKPDANPLTWFLKTFLSLTMDKQQRLLSILSMSRADIKKQRSALKQWLDQNPKMLAVFNNALSSEQFLTSSKNWLQVFPEAKVLSSFNEMAKHIDRKIEIEKTNLAESPFEVDRLGGPAKPGTELHNLESFQKALHQARQAYFSQPLIQRLTNDKPIKTLHRDVTSMSEAYVGKDPFIIDWFVRIRDLIVEVSKVVFGAIGLGSASKQSLDDDSQVKSATKVCQRVDKKLGRDENEKIRTRTVSTSALPRMVQ